MSKVDRKGFLKVAGLGSVAAAGAAGVPFLRQSAGTSKGMTFRATAGVPRPPLPGYATHVVEGSVDFTRGDGLITTRVLAGSPEPATAIGLPGLSRQIRVTRVTQEGPRVRLNGVIEDRSQLIRGESPEVEVLIDRNQGTVQAPFLGRLTELQLTNN
jgi:hypothetical protein